MSQHESPSEHAGKTVVAGIRHGGKEILTDFRVEDWWDRVSGRSWTVMEGNPACLKYAMRSGFEGLPLDDEVVYGKTPDGLGHLVHITEIAA